MPPRPHRQRKGDRLLSPGASAAQVACDYALAPFDRAALDAERRWGIDRLPEVVSPELAAKYGRSIAALNSAIEAEDAEKVTALAGNCVKGIAAMEAEATAAGAMPLPAKVVEVEYEGVRIAIVQEPRDLQFYEKNPGTITYTAREIAIAMAALSRADGLVAATKEAFPHATITAYRPKLPDEFWERGDEIPH